jgi:DNA-binding NtrC family response regulator
MTTDKTLCSVLVVDDEPLVLKYATSVICNLGYKRVFRASTALDARALLLAETFSLIISDVSLPDGDGRQVLREALLINPNARLVLISGFVSTDLFLSEDLRGHVDFLEKPFTADDISQLLAETFERNSQPLNT